MAIASATRANTSIQSSLKAELHNTILVMSELKRYMKRNN